jgi:hypothetical protein
MLGLVLAIVLLAGAVGVPVTAPKESWAHDTSAVLFLMLVAVLALWLGGVI